MLPFGREPSIGAFPTRPSKELPSALSFGHQQQPPKLLLLFRRARQPSETRSPPSMKQTEKSSSFSVREPSSSIEAQVNFASPNQFYFSPLEAQSNEAHQVLVCSFGPSLFLAQLKSSSLAMSAHFQNRKAQVSVQERAQSNAKTNLSWVEICGAQVLRSGPSPPVSSKVQFRPPSRRRRGDPVFALINSWDSTKGSWSSVRQGRRGWSSGEGWQPVNQRRQRVE